jgi:adenylyltransferase/sulfurtransferase
LVRYHAYGRHLTPATALDIFQPYDLILDCTDHPTSRYLISDAAVLSGKPVVSAAALRTDGQLLVLNNPPTTGPCYRCIFPKPPPADSVISCGDGGVLGPVVGVMGVLMALEAIKIITGPESRPETCTPTPSDEPHPASPSSPSPATMLIFAATSSPPFRSIRLHGKRPRCPSCSPAAPITRASLTLGSLDYVAFCGRASPTAILGPHERITAQQLQAALARPDRPILLDVRDPTQYAICSLPGSVNVPLAAVDALAPAAALQPEPDAADPGLRDVVASDRPVYALCRFGNDSQLAVRKLKELGYDRGGTRWIGDVRGGLRAWKRDVDPLWPEY